MKKYILISIIALIGVVQGQELITLTSPITKPSQTNVRVSRVIIDVITKSITVEFVGNNGEGGVATYTTPVPVSKPTQPTGAALLTTLNKANFSGVNTSLVNRILTRLQTDGYIPAGTISGTPE